MRDACGALRLGILVISLVSVSMGLPVQSANDLSKAPACKFDGTGKGPCSISMLEELNSSNDNSIDVTIQSWRGYATKDGKSHQLRLNLERVMNINPAEVRKMLESNASLKHIQSTIRTEDGSAVRRGNIRLDNSIYQLTNITVTPSGNGSVLNAGIAGPIGGPRSRAGQSIANLVVGYTTLTISTLGGEEVAKGMLVMSSPEYRGTYQVLLDQQAPGRGPRAGMAGPGS